MRFLSSESVFLSCAGPKCAFSFQKAYSNLTQPLPHRFGRSFATVSPNEAILFALGSYRDFLRVGIGCMPCFIVFFCWSSQNSWPPLSLCCCCPVFAGFSSVTEIEGVFNTSLVKARHDTRCTSAKLWHVLLLFVAMLVCEMSLSVTVTALSLHAYRYRCYVALLLCHAILLLCHAILVHVIVMPCVNHAMSCLTRLHLCHVLPC